MKRRVITVPKRQKKMSDLKVTAMVSIYNSSRWLRARLTNLFETNAHKRGQLLIYCVNAQSPDPTDNLICESFAGYDNFHYEVIDFCTVYGAWNHIINRTSTKYLTNCNTDDLNAPNYFDEAIRTLEQTKSSIVHCDWYSIGPSINHWSEIRGTANNATYFNPDADLISCGHMPLWDRSVHDKVGLFDPWFKALGDADLWLRAWRNGIKDFEFLNAPLGAYRWRDGDNLWNRTEEGQRAAEWDRLRNRQPGKLTF